MRTMMKTVLAAVLTVSASMALAAGMTKEEATAKATAAHPGEVTKVYQEKNKGQDVWEVKIKGQDGKKWEVFYAVDTGEFVKESSE